MVVDTLLVTLQFFPRGLAYVALGVVVLYLAKWILDLATPYHVSDQLSRKSNAALGLSISGYLLGVIVVFVAVLYTPFASGDGDWRFTAEFGFDVIEVFLYSVGAIAVLNLTRYLIDHLVLYKFDVEKEIIENQNLAAGAVEFGVYLSVSLVVAASLAGYGDAQLGTAVPTTLDEIIRSAVFFVLGLGVLVLYALFYQVTTVYDIHDEIEKDNAAVGVTMAANLIAVALVAFKAVAGEFLGWSESLIGFVVFAVIGFLLLVIVRWIIDKAMFPKVKIADELSSAQNVGVAFIVGGVVVSTALILLFAV